MAPAAHAADFTVTSYGTAADGKTLDTAALQKTIDAAHSAGGGRVVVPAGVFLSGALFMRQNVELYLSEGAVIKGSDNIEDYPKLMTRIEGHFEPWRMALINATNIDRLKISGPGKLDGNGLKFWTAFWKRRSENPKCTNLEVERPRLVFIDRCHDIQISGLRLRDSGFWNIHIYRSQRVTLEDLDIQSVNPHMRAPSTDGIDIDSCQDVTIRRCRIAVDDDGIALKGSKGPLAHKDESSPPVENILIENCEFGISSGVMTCGSEATVVRNVTVRDCIVNGKTNILRLKLRPDTPQLYENIVIERLKLDCPDGRVIEVRPWKQFFDLQGHAPQPSVVKNVVIRDITGNFGTMGVLNGNEIDTIDGLTLENINLKVTDPAFELGVVQNFKIKNVTVNSQPFAPTRNAEPYKVPAAK